MKRALALLLVLFVALGAALPAPARAAEIQISLWDTLDSILALPFKILNFILGPPPKKKPQPGELPVKKSPYLREV